jgi:hypothetical protein
MIPPGGIVLRIAGKGCDERGSIMVRHAITLVVCDAISTSADWMRFEHKSMRQDVILAWNREEKSRH